MTTTEVTFLPIVTKPYKGWSDRALVDGSAKIVTGMTKNPFFPTLDVKVLAYAELAAAFASLYNQAKFRDVNVVAAKNDARNLLIAQSISLGNDVTQLADSDLTMLRSTGLPLKRAPQKGVLSTPQNLTILNGTNLGELVVKVDSIKLASIYNFLYAIDPLTDTSNWSRVSSTTSKVVIGGLKVVSRVWIKVEAVSGNGQSTWSVELLSPFVQDRTIKK